MKSKYKNINRFFVVVNRALFRKDSKLSYQRTLEALERLAQEIINTETDETVWCIGEYSDASLDSIIVGAYWFLVDYHSGQNSLEYRVSCRLNEIFKPGMTTGPESESSEQDVYNMFERFFNEAHGMNPEEII